MDWKLWEGFQRFFSQNDKLKVMVGVGRDPMMLHAHVGDEKFGFLSQKRKKNLWCLRVKEGNQDKSKVVETPECVA